MADWFVIHWDLKNPGAQKEMRDLVSAPEKASVADLLLLHTLELLRVQAKVKAETLSDVWTLTQNDSNPEKGWLHNEGVKPSKGVTEARSSMVGDLFMSQEGVFMVDTIGFVPIF